MNTKNYAEPFRKREMEDAKHDEERYQKLIAECKELANELGVNHEDYTVNQLRKMVAEKRNK